MKKGYLRVLVDLLFLLAILIIIDNVVGYIGFKYTKWLNKDPRNSDAALVNYNLNASEPDVAIIGSSTAICHYVPDIIHDSLLSITGKEFSVFNMGMSKQRMAYNYYALKCFLDRKIPKIVIEDVWASNVSIDDKPSFFEGLRPYVNTNTNIKELFVKHDAYDFKMMSHMYCYNTELIKLLFAATRTAGANGYKSSTVEMNSITKLQDKDNSEVDSLSIEEFDKMINLCKENGIQLFVVLSPAIRASDTKSASYLYMKKRCEVNNIPFLDYSNDQRFYHTHYFADPLHMNRYGAEFFTSELMKDIKCYLD